MAFDVSKCGHGGVSTWPSMSQPVCRRPLPPHRRRSSSAPARLPARYCAARPDARGREGGTVTSTGSARRSPISPGRQLVHGRESSASIIGIGPTGTGIYGTVNLINHSGAVISGDFRAVAGYISGVNDRIDHERAYTRRRRAPGLHEQWCDRGWRTRNCRRDQPTDKQRPDHRSPVRHSGFDNSQAGEYRNDRGCDCDQEPRKQYRHARKHRDDPRKAPAPRSCSKATPRNQGRSDASSTEA